MLFIFAMLPIKPSSHVYTSVLSFFRQDVAFFDANKTGQLVNRLTADIQEFKSSFKLVISQVLQAQLSLLTLICQKINLLNFYFFPLNISCVFLGSAEYHTDSRVFCVSLCHLTKAHRFDSGSPPLSSGSRGSHWLIPAETLSYGSRTGYTIDCFL